MSRKLIANLLGLVLIAAFPGAARADWYDNFDDGDCTGQDPFDIDDPCWIERPVTATQTLVGVDEGRLRVTAVNTMFPFVFHGMSVEQDPNQCFFDNTRAHYMLANVRSHDDNWDPNNGMVGVWMHGDLVSGWTAYDFEYQLNSGWSAITTYCGFTWFSLKTKQRYHWGYPLSMIHPNSPWLVDPNLYGDPNKYNEQNVWTKDAQVPHWMLLQFDPNGTHWDPNRPSDANDPNCHWLRAAHWTGDKYDWDGTWLLQANCVGAMLGKTVTNPLGSDFPFDPNVHMDDYLHQAGYNAIGAFSGGEAKQPGTTYYCVDASYDDFENRDGYFSVPECKVTLNVVKPNYGSVTPIDPDLRDPTEPNTPEQKILRSTNGTPIVMTATPISGKAFGGWAIWSDPSKYPDANYASLDANTVLFLTVDGNKLVEATFKCGSGIEPLLVIGMAALALGVVIRRLT